MSPVPDVDAVVAVAKALGIHLGPEEAVPYRQYLLEPRRAFDTFVQARVSAPIDRVGTPLQHKTRHRCAWEGKPS
jgi:hypothetical protein